MKHERFDIHQHITNQIIAVIEQGAGKFTLPWQRAGSIMHATNIASKKPYRGINILALWAASEQHGFRSGIWGTYLQWADQGANVRKGEKSSYVVFYKELEVAGDTDENETRLIARATPVFAAEQVDGYEMSSVPVAYPIEPVAAADAFVQATQAVIHHGGSLAYYRTSTDIIQLPLREDFVGTATSTAQEAYYSTLLHELTHWTSAPHRCNRQLGKRFGDAAYAMEELIAELGAAFLCSELGITPEPRNDHAQYLSSWLNVMKADKRAIFTAASVASKATDYLHNYQRKEA
jgi:antirestriction protein ArdC